MVPGQKFDKPGKSPFMDMDLVPVYADEAADEGAVASARASPRTSACVRRSRSGSLASGFSAVGAIAVDERTMTGVQSRVQGFVERLFVRATFEPRARRAADRRAVRSRVGGGAGGVLALQGLVAARRAPRWPTRRAAACSLLGMPDAEIARVEREGRASGRVTVTSPASGIVWEISARDGMAVMPGTNLLRIAGLGSVWLIAEVPEAQAAQIAIGDPVEARTNAYPGPRVQGAREALLPEVNITTRTVRARVVLSIRAARSSPACSRTATSGVPRRSRRYSCRPRR